MNPKLASTVLCVVLISGCASTNRYALSKDDAGHLVRLDTHTGEIMLIEDGKVTPVSGTTVAATSTPQVTANDVPPVVDQPAGGTTWPTRTLPELGDTTAELTSYWFNGKLHYLVGLYPLSKRLRLVYNGYYHNPSFTLMLDDKSGKQLVWTPLPVNHFNLKHNKLRNVDELVAEGVLDMSSADYAKIGGWKLIWNP